MMLFNFVYTKSFGYSVLDVPLKYRKLIILRAVSGFVWLHGYWGAFKYMPLNVTTCILMTGPIPVAIFARIILKEQMSKYDIICMISSFIGILIINNPFSEA